MAILSQSQKGFRGHTGHARAGTLPPPPPAQPSPFPTSTELLELPILARGVSAENEGLRLLPAACCPLPAAPCSVRMVPIYSAGSRFLPAIATGVGLRLPPVTGPLSVPSLRQLLVSPRSPWVPSLTKRDKNPGVVLAGPSPLDHRRPQGLWEVSEGFLEELRADLGCEEGDSKRKNIELSQRETRVPPPPATVIGAGVVVWLGGINQSRPPGLSLKILRKGLSFHRSF